MFCSNCGKELRDGIQFCTGCGASIKPAGNIQQTNTAGGYAAQNNTAGGTFTQGYVSNQAAAQNNMAGGPVATEPVYYTTGGSVAKKSKKGSSKKGKLSTKIVAIAVAVAIVAGSVLFTWLNPWANNQFMKLILNSEDYTAYVIGKNIKKASKNLTDEKIQTLAGTMVMSAYSSAYMLGSMDSGIMAFPIMANAFKGSADISAQINMTDTIKDIVEESMGYDSDMITWIDSATISSSYNSTGNKIGTGADIKVNNVDIASANVAMDFDKGSLYLEAPELLPHAAEAEVIDPDESGYKEYMEAYDKIMSAVPNAKDTEKIIARYIECVLKQIEDVEEESEKLEVGDISQRCTKLTFNIDDKMIKKMGTAVLEEAQEDDDLKDIIRDIAKSMDEDADDIIDSFESGIDDTLDDLKDTETSGEDYAEVTLWINSNGEITGLDIVPENSDMKISAHDVKKGRKCATEIEMAQGRQKVSLSGEGTIKGGKRSMNLSVKAVGIEFADIELTDVKEKELREGLFSGEITISANEELKGAVGLNMEDEYADLLFGSKITIASNMESANKGSTVISLEMDNQIVAKIDVKSQLGDGNVMIPPGAEHYSDIDDLEYEVEPDKIIDALEEAGAPDDIIDEIEDEY